MLVQKPFRIQEDPELARKGMVAYALICLVLGVLLYVVSRDMAILGLLWSIAGLCFAISAYYHAEIKIQELKEFYEKEWRKEDNAGISQDSEKKAV